jgi:hypothetical protein
MMGSSPVFQGILNEPIFVNEGNSVWNNAKLLTFRIFDSQMNIPTFSVITLLFSYNETLYPDQTQHSGPPCETEYWPGKQVNKFVDRKNLNWFYNQSENPKPNTFFLP